MDETFRSLRAMATVLTAQSVSDASADPALEKVNQEHGVEYAKERFGTKLRKSGQGLKIDATFCPDNGQTPFATAEWEQRSFSQRSKTRMVMLCSSRPTARFPRLGVSWRPTWLYPNISTATQTPQRTRKKRSSISAPRHANDQRLGFARRVLRFARGWRKILPRPDLVVSPSAWSIQ